MNKHNPTYAKSTFASLWQSLPLSHLTYASQLSKPDNLFKEQICRNEIGYSESIKVED